MDEKKLVRKALKKGVGKALSFARAVGRKEARDLIDEANARTGAIAAELAKLRWEHANSKPRAEVTEQELVSAQRALADEKARSAKHIANVETDRDRFLALLIKHGISAFEQP